MTGTLVIVTEINRQFEAVAQRVMAWAGADASLIRTTSIMGPTLALVIPDEVVQRHGPLLLKRDGPDITQFSVPFSRSIVTVGNGDALTDDPDVELENQITLTFLKQSGNTYRLTYTNARGHGRVKIWWGDSGLGKPHIQHGPESKSLTHTYAKEGTYRVRVESEDGFTATETWIKVPSDAGIRIF